MVQGFLYRNKIVETVHRFKLLYYLYETIIITSVILSLKNPDTTHNFSTQFEPWIGFFFMGYIWRLDSFGMTQNIFHFRGKNVNL